jgi:hypothetical protein
MEAAKEPLPALVGTLLLQWSVLSGASGIGNITGTFSAVSVPPEFERKGEKCDASHVITRKIVHWRSNVHARKVIET